MWTYSNVVKLSANASGDKCIVVQNLAFVVFCATNRRQQTKVEAVGHIVCRFVLCRRLARAPWPWVCCFVVLGDSATSCEASRTTTSATIDKDDGVWHEWRESTCLSSASTVFTFVTRHTLDNRKWEDKGKRGRETVVVSHRAPVTDETCYWCASAIFPFSWMDDTWTGDIMLSDSAVQWHECMVDSATSWRRMFRSSSIQTTDAILSLYKVLIVLKDVDKCFKSIISDYLYPLPLNGQWRRLHLTNYFCK